MAVVRHDRRLTHPLQVFLLLLTSCHSIRKKLVAVGDVRNVGELLDAAPSGSTETGCALSMAGEEARGSPPPFPSWSAGLRLSPDFHRFSTAHPEASVEISELIFSENSSSDAIS